VVGLDRIGLDWIGLMLQLVAGGVGAALLSDSYTAAEQIATTEPLASIQPTHLPPRVHCQRSLPQLLPGVPRSPHPRPVHIRQGPVRRHHYCARIAAPGRSRHCLGPLPRNICLDHRVPAPHNARVAQDVGAVAGFRCEDRAGVVVHETRDVEAKGGLGEVVEGVGGVGGVDPHRTQVDTLGACFVLGLGDRNLLEVVVGQ